MEGIYADQEKETERRARRGWNLKDSSSELGMPFKGSDKEGVGVGRWLQLSVRRNRHTPTPLLSLFIFSRL